MGTCPFVKKGKAIHGISSVYLGALLRLGGGQAGLRIMASICKVLPRPGSGLLGSGAHEAPHSECRQAPGGVVYV